MPRVGDPETRPAEDAVIIDGTAEMWQEATLLGSNGVVAWIDGMVKDVSTKSVQRAVAAACNALVDDVCVVRHHPEQFFITFIHQHHCDYAVNRGRIPVEHHSLQVRRWRVEAHAEDVAMDYHVRIRLECVPLHSWNLHTVTRVLGSAASVDYIEAKSVRKEATDLLWVWAWTENPSLIPKVKRFTLLARSPPASGSRPRGRRSLHHRVLVHLAIVEDFTSVDASGNPPPPYALTFQRWEVDGEGAVGRRAPSPPHRDDRHGRRDDDDREGCDGCHRLRSWGDTLRRSLSRGPRDPGQGNRGQHDGRDGHRRPMSCEPVMLEAALPITWVRPAPSESEVSAAAVLAARRQEATVASSLELGSPPMGRGCCFASSIPRDGSKVFQELANAAIVA
jgi:hypothetical protein